MSDDKHILHFSLGPVQGFIGTARRTRDLWAGSFLLSWLTAHAIATVPDWRKNIRFPHVAKDDLVNAVAAKLEDVQPASAPSIATVPNRFKADVPEDFDPALCRTAVNDAWKKLAAAVWDAFPDKVASGGKDTRSIWDRQVDKFWEISWVKGGRGGHDGVWLDNRKAWRSHRPQDEDKGGDHCTLMGDWQEISGYVRAREGARRKPDGSKDENRQDKFWNAFRELDDWKRNKLLLDIVEGERLCAIALIKRLFPRLTKETRDEVFGWNPCRDGGGNWPSTGHIAAAHWITRAWKNEQNLCESYATLVEKNLHPLHFAEQKSQIACLPEDGRFKELDANFFDENDLKNRRAMPLLDKNSNPIDTPNDGRHADLRVTIMNSLKELTNKVGAPAGYFALLRMDGDKTGDLLEEGKEQYVAQALNDFTEQVKAIVPSPEHNGVLVYAGGDDVLALFPIEDALKAALALRKAYLQAFQPYLPRLGRADPPTISAGLVFADHHEPFRHVVEESRRLLEDVAKDKNGRDSIACSVLKPSGKAVEWVATWKSGEAALTELVEKIATQMREDAPFSSRFIYNLRARYLDPIADRFDELELTHEELKAILTAERAGDRERRKHDDALIETISQISRPHKSREVEPQSAAIGAPLQTDALMLARFLAQKGLKVEGEKK